MGCNKSKGSSVVQTVDIEQLNHQPSPSLPSHNCPSRTILILNEEGQRVADVGGGGNERQLQEIMGKGRQEIKEAQEKLNSSLTIPIVDAEAKLIDSGSWLYEKKDVQKRFNVLPPIAGHKKVKQNSVAFEVQ